MKNNIKYINIIYYALLVTGVVYFFYIILFNYTLNPNIEAFPDSIDYRVQSEKSIFSIDFYIPKPTIYFSARPFSVPLLYKSVGSNPYNLIILQKTIYCISVLILMLSFLKYISSVFFKLISVFLLLYFFTWWNIVGWSNIVLSESLSMSFMFLWIAIIFIYYKNQTNLTFILLIFISVLLSFTRDTWPYIIIIFATLNVFLFMLFQKKIDKKNMIYLVFSIVLFFIQNYTSNVGQRYKIPVFNSIVGRVSQQDEYVNWFKKEGMPIAEKIVKDFRGIDIDKDENRLLVYSKYNDSSYTKLFSWILTDGKSTYQKFLLTHWSYFFLEDQSAQQKNKIFSCTLLDYIPKPDGFYLKPDGTFPYFSLQVSAIILCILILLFRRNKNKILLFPIILSILCVVNALISYNADALEVKRHLFITEIMINFINIISILLILDYFLLNYKKIVNNFLSLKQFLFNYKP